MDTHTAFKIRNITVTFAIFKNLSDSAVKNFLECIFSDSSRNEIDMFILVFKFSDSKVA